jgi:hypothetical protein
MAAFIAKCASGDLLSSCATGVGQAVIDGEDEQPFPFMREAHVRRTEEAALNLVTHSA